MERERLAKRDQARLPVLQEKREQERAQQLVSDAEDEERMRTSRIFWDLLERCGRVGLLSFYFEDPRYFDRPRVPSFLAAPLDEPLGPSRPRRPSHAQLRHVQPLNLDEALGEPSRPWRPTQTELQTAKLRLHEDLVESAEFLELLRTTGPTS